jgi:uncharacterized protein YbjT (DUF2867 family)
MFAITGITGKVGGGVAEALLKSGRAVRAVVRDPNKGKGWADRGCQVAVASMDDAAALTTAFADCQGVFVLLPPVFDPLPDFAESRAAIAALRKALDAARPRRIVCLSTIGAGATELNLLTQLTIMEQTLRDVSPGITFLRAAWFLENSSWDVPWVCERGVMPSFLQPLDKPVPMVAVADIARVAAELLQEKNSWRSVVELEGPRRVSPNELSRIFSVLLGREVRAEAVPRDTWDALFRSQGMMNPTPRIRMLDGFNDGWIEFENGQASSRKGFIEPATVLQQLIDRYNGK